MSSNTEESAKSAFALDEKPAKPANQLEIDEQPPTKNAAVARLEAWCGETTLHGVSNIVKDDHWTPYKIAWIVIVVLAIGANMYHLYTVIYGYLQYPTTVWPSQRHISLLCQTAGLCDMHTTLWTTVSLFLITTGILRAR